MPTLFLSALGMFDAQTSTSVSSHEFEVHSPYFGRSLGYYGMRPPNSCLLNCQVMGQPPRHSEFLDPAPYRSALSTHPCFTSAVVED